MTERTTVRLPDDLLRRAKRKALAEGRTLTALIEEGLRRVLKDPEAETRQRRLLPPISSAAGGVFPGVDLSDTSSLQSLEDAAHLSIYK